VIGLTALLIGIDPGKTCGFATLNIVGDRYDFTSMDLDTMATIAHLNTLLTTANTVLLPVYVAAELFTPGGNTAKQTRQTDASQVIGAAQTVTKQHGGVFMTQGIADAQRVGSPAALRALGWWAPGFDHRNKAASQVALLFMKLQPAEFERRTRAVLE
jgi:hypothetical protein